MLYETLQRFQNDGLVVETETPVDLRDQASSRWRFYQATSLGRQVLEAEIARLEGDLAAARAKFLQRSDTVPARVVSTLMSRR